MQPTLVKSQRPTALVSFRFSCVWPSRERSGTGFKSFNFDPRGDSYKMSQVSTHKIHRKSRKSNHFRGKQLMNEPVSVRRALRIGLAGLATMLFLSVQVKISA